MKKNIIAIICGVIAAAVVITGSLISFGKLQEKDSIGASAALTIALNDAGVSKEEAKNTKSKFERDNGKYIFDVEFDANGFDYEYNIDASTGEIINRDVEKENNQQSITKKTKNTTTKANAVTENKTVNDTGNNTEKTTKSKTTKSKNAIGVAKAKSIALENAGFSASQVDFTKAKLDYDDGVAVYEIEFFKGNTEYEYEINAKTGKIISFDREVKATKKKTTTTKASYIGVDKAKSIALKNAGASSSSVRFTKAKLDYDDGVAVYEIEFVKGNTEYEYEINAKTGKIRSVDKEIKKSSKQKVYDDDDDDYDDDYDDDDDDYDDDDD